MSSSLDTPPTHSEKPDQMRARMGAGAEASLAEEIRELRLKNLELAANLRLARRKLALYQKYEAEVEASLASIVISALDRHAESPQTSTASVEKRRTPPDSNAVELALTRERNRIAQDIHDGLSQQLTGLVLELEACHRSIRKDPAQVDAQLLKAIRTARAALADIRNYMFGLRSPSPSHLGLIPSLERMVADFEQRNIVPSRLKVFGTVRPLEPEAEDSLLRVAQEALTNVGKHAHAKQVEVSLRFGPSALELCVFDDGIGFNAATTLARPQGEGSMGLLGMQERLKAAGGHLVVESSPGAGTRVVALLPLNDRTVREHSTTQG